MITLAYNTTVFNVLAALNECAPCLTFGGSLTGVLTCESEDVTVELTSLPCNINYHFLQVTTSGPLVGEFTLEIYCQDNGEIVLTETVRFDAAPC